MNRAQKRKHYITAKMLPVARARDFIAELKRRHVPSANGNYVVFIRPECIPMFDPDRLLIVKPD
jgi:hypothetical protein